MSKLIAIATHIVILVLHIAPTTRDTTFTGMSIMATATESTSPMDGG